jgi:hypothetical protein
VAVNKRVFLQLLLIALVVFGLAVASQAAAPLTFGYPIP